MAPAAGPQPNAGPLWKAYPLDTAPPTTATTTAPVTPTGTQRPATSPERPTAISPGALDPLHAGGSSMAVTIIFFGSLAAAFLLMTGTLVRRARRRRAARRAMCEITWSPAAEGGAFRATTWETGDAPHVVAASPCFERRTPGPPDEDLASRQAYTELVRRLMAEGWEPYGRGHAWWEMRLRRSERSGTPGEAIHG
jgi:hypothetical protein